MMTIREITKRLRRRELSPVELTRQTLDQIKQAQPMGFRSACSLLGTVSKKGVCWKLVTPTNRPLSGTGGGHRFTALHNRAWESQPRLIGLMTPKSSSGAERPQVSANGRRGLRYGAGPLADARGSVWLLAYREPFRGRGPAGTTGVDVATNGDTARKNACATKERAADFEGEIPAGLQGATDVSKGLPKPRCVITNGLHT